MERLDFVKENFILGTDKLDAEKQRDLWLSEPQTLLTHREQACSNSFYNGGMRRALVRAEKSLSQTTPPPEKIAVKNIAMLAVIGTPLRISSRVSPTST
jgi:hypothetical protein